MWKIKEKWKKNHKLEIKISVLQEKKTINHEWNRNKSWDVTVEESCKLVDEISLKKGNNNNTNKR